jgi:hypothetical protein
MHEHSGYQACFFHGEIVGEIGAWVNRYSGD